VKEAHLMLQNNNLSGLKGQLQLQNAVPAAHPVLPSHDELYVLQEDYDLVERAFEKSLKELADRLKNLCSSGTRKTEKHE
jgi:hypothetical protein